MQGCRMKGYIRQRMQVRRRRIEDSDDSYSSQPGGPSTRGSVAILAQGVWGLALAVGSVALPVRAQSPRTSC